MENILKELWYGNICPFEDYYSNTKEMWELSKLIANDRDRIAKNLSEEGKKYLSGTAKTCWSSNVLPKRRCSTMRFRSACASPWRASDEIRCVFPLYLL